MTKAGSFLRWRIQLIEKGIQKLSFKPEGINSMVQITDLKNSSGLSKFRGLQQSIKKTLPIIEDNYPEFIAKKVRIAQTPLTPEESGRLLQVFKLKVTYF